LAAPVFSALMTLCVFLKAVPETYFSAAEGPSWISDLQEGGSVGRARTAQRPTSPRARPCALLNEDSDGA